VSPVVFVVLAALTVLSALTVVVHRNPVHSAVALVATLCLLAVFFFALDAQLVAILQVIVYAGAIVVLFLFVIMLLNLSQEATEEDTRPVQRWLGLLAALGLGGVLSGAALMAPVPKGMQAPAVVPLADEIPTIGRLLFSDYLLAFEALSFLLLVAAVGALLLSKRKFE
jgi:NADH-quinone oxidoreductase subunit J